MPTRALHVAAQPMATQPMAASVRHAAATGPLDGGKRVLAPRAEAAVILMPNSHPSGKSEFTSSSVISICKNWHVTVLQRNTCQYVYDVLA